MYRSIFLFLSIFAIGCATTHVRVAQNIKEKNIKKVLILNPEIDSKVKYIDVPKYFSNAPAQRKIWNHTIGGYKEALFKKGYKPFTEKDLITTSLYKNYSKKIKMLLRKTGEKIIHDDLEYINTEMAESKLKKIPIPVPEEWKKFDAIIFLYGDAKLETNREYCQRWRGNIIYNILAFPLTVATFALPFLAPLTFIGSGEYSFQKSPDTTFLNMVIVDIHSRKVIYQYDYFIQEWGFNEDAFFEITEEALEELPEKE